MAEEHPLKPFYSVLVLALGCSLFVAVAAVGLKPLQEANRSLDQKKNILQAAGIYRQDKPIEQQFERIITKQIDLASGRYISSEDTEEESMGSLSKSPATESTRELERSEDPAGIRKLEQISVIYLVKKKDKITQVVLPVRGKGLWSTMFAYVSIDADLTTIRGISFYEHGETPGLGGEIENTHWQAGWQDKKLFSSEGTLEFHVVKDISRITPEKKIHTVDGLSGATLTSQGVDKLMRFWFGDHGFKPFFNRIRSQGGFNG